MVARFERTAVDGGFPERFASGAIEAEDGLLPVSLVLELDASCVPQQRIVGWRFWPEDDFPRTHTLKIRRDPIRTWATDEPANAAVSSGR